MNNGILFFLAVTFLGNCLPVQAKTARVEGTEVEYAAAGTVMRGYVVRDSEQTGKRPGILVVHEWWGHNDFARKRAEMLALAGYIALAVDMYGDGITAAHPKEAGAFAAAATQDMDSAQQRFEAALALLRRQPDVDPEKIAAIGYCFGGGIVLNMARRGVDLAGVVSFHGSLATNNPARPDSVKARVLVCNGSEDSFVPPEQSSAFNQEMTLAGVDYIFHNYPNARHSFTNPDADRYALEFGLDIAYNAAADEQSWQDMRDFFQALFDEDR